MIMVNLWWWFKEMVWVIIQPLEGSNPLCFSSACSWQRAQGPQQQCTQQSPQVSFGNPNFDLSFSL